MIKKRAYNLMSLLINIALLTVFVPGKAREESVQSELSALIASATSKTEELSIPTDNNQARVVLGNANVMFIENVGQFADDARFQVRGGDHTTWLAEDAIWVTVLEPADVNAPHELPDREPQLEHQPRNGVNIRLSFMDANPNPLIEPFNRLETKVSYFMGSDPDQWRPDVPVWGGIRYVDLYPGVDLEISGENGNMSPRLLAHPGADLSAVRMRVEGAQALALDGNALRLNTHIGEFTLPLLVIEGQKFERLNVERTNVKRVNAGKFDVSAPFAPYNPQSKIQNRKSPVQNPQSNDLLYGTFLGGGHWEYGEGITVDGSGAVYLTGHTWSTDFPTTPGAFDTSHNGYFNVFVVKVNPAGSGLDYGTFLGGGGYDFDETSGIAVDGSGAAYVTGWTESADFPTTPGAFDTTHNGYVDVFVVKVNPAGSGLDYGTFLGGSGSDAGISIAVDGSGAAYVVGGTSSTGFPTTPGALDRTLDGYSDAFVVKVNPTGSDLGYGTFLGGGYYDYGFGIAVDGSGAAYVGGGTSSTDFPTTPGAFDTTYNGGTHDVFVVKVNPVGSSLGYATFLGGGGDDYGYGIVVDASWATYVVGVTHSSDFPTTPDAFDTTYNGGLTDAFVVKVNPTGSDLDYGTFLGGWFQDYGRGIVMDGSGAAYVMGYTSSTGFPTTPGAFDMSHNGSSDVFVVKVNPTGSSLDYGTFLGGGDGDFGRGIAVDGSGAAYVTGGTYSTDFPTTPGAFDTTFNGGEYDAFVVKVAFWRLSNVTIIGPVMGFTQTEYTFTADVTPITATIPITYVWQATGQSPVTNTSGTNDMVTYTWETTGTKTITVTVTNKGGSVNITHTILIYTDKIYLPLL